MTNPNEFIFAPMCRYWSTPINARFLKTVLMTWLPKKANKLYTCHAIFFDAYMPWRMYPRIFCESALVIPTRNHTFTYLLHLPCSQLVYWINNDIELHIKIKKCCWQNKISVALLWNIEWSYFGGKSIMVLLGWVWIYNHVPRSIIEQF